jgi:hypothetical protein
VGLLLRDAALLGAGFWFGLQQFFLCRFGRLPAAASPGAVPAIRCGTGGFACIDRFAAKTRVSLVGRAAPGFAFSRWSSGCSGTASTCNVVLSRDVQVFATFTPKTAAATVAASLAPARLRVGWQASVGKGELVVRGRVSRAVRLRVELHGRCRYGA